MKHGVISLRLLSHKQACFPHANRHYSRRKIFRKSAQDGLEFSRKSCSLSVRVNGFREQLKRRKTWTWTSAKKSPHLQQMTMKELRGRFAEAFGETTQRQQQGLARQTHRLASASAGRRRPVGASPAPGRGIGQRCRSASVAAKRKEDHARRPSP